MLTCLDTFIVQVFFDGFRFSLEFHLDDGCWRVERTGVENAREKVGYDEL